LGLGGAAADEARHAMNPAASISGNANAANNWHRLLKIDGIKIHSGRRSDNAITRFAGAPTLYQPQTTNVHMVFLNRQTPQIKKVRNTVTLYFDNHYNLEYLLNERLPDLGGCA
jgi:hypothetical protein